MEPSRRFVPQNRAQRRRLIKSFHGFKPKGRDAARTMNRHMKIAAEQQKAEQAVAAAVKDGALQDERH